MAAGTLRHFQPFQLKPIERLLIRRDGKREAELPLSMVHNITLLTKAVSL